ncbi:MAG: ATPase, partial [Gammaproteobacteria bacterium]
MKHKPISIALAALFGVSLAQADVEFSSKGGLKMKTTDGNFAFQVGGRVMADAAFYDEDASSLGDGTEIRRARLFAKGILFHDWAFKGQY